MDIHQILKFLPHRYPFLLVDRVVDLQVGKSITAIKNVTYNEAFFQGHFPDYKVMPGVLMIEAIAQAGGILLFHSLDDPKSKLVLLSKIDNAKFRRTVVPGDQLRLEVELLKLKSRFCNIRGKALVGEEVAVEAEILAFVVDAAELHGKP